MSQAVSELSILIKKEEEKLESIKQLKKEYIAKMNVQSYTVLAEIQRLKKLKNKRIIQESFDSINNKIQKW
jgi:hypothetical protein